MKPSLALSSHRFPKSLMVVISCICGATIPNLAHSADINQQRDLYEQAQEYLDKEQLSQYRALRPKIEDYPLTPYVDYRAFLAEINEKTPEQVNRFIEENEAFPFSFRVRAPYLEALAKRSDWKSFLNFQTSEPKGEKYRCHYFNAQYQTGQISSALKGAESLWLSGTSIDDACEPLFEVWEKTGGKTDSQVIERMLLVYQARNGSLLKYLNKQLKGAQEREQGEHIVSLFRAPEKVAAFAKKQYVTPTNQTLSELALQKLARKNVELAKESYSSVVTGQKLNSTRSQALADYIAFRLINTESTELAIWRDKAIAQSSKKTLIERRVRLAIQHADWEDVRYWIGQLPQEAQQSNRWQFWLGRSEIETGLASKGNQRLQNLLGERNFYSVAAAKEVGQSIYYPTSSLTLDRSLVTPHQVALNRIKELIALDKITAAKSEWRWLLSRVDSSTKEMLAVYAASRRWYHLTVTASIEAKMWDNLEVRFPVAHRWWFDFYGDKHDIDPITLMSLARQESGMDVEARSPVGARGIMQIMPRTAKYTAKKYKLSYRSSNDLYEVGKNIEIGSQYLKSLLERYDNNRIFALAAYNAGPHRVKTWRARTEGKLDAYAFIEAIPFKETRGYVQNILMFETYYRDILGKDGAFLNSVEIGTRY
ncbi:murein transglycosylase [Vibrio sonorensis]|uniref:murein transglycosylase n=1 Tax=Vibrio sonorensis TaxID=1004316 RepID=UPI0008DA9336|nr:murein transglycosylase [Vibrio sonorensis]